MLSGFPSPAGRLIYAHNLSCPRKAGIHNVRRCEPDLREWCGKPVAFSVIVQAPGLLRLRLAETELLTSQVPGLFTKKIMSDNAAQCILYDLIR